MSTEFTVRDTLDAVRSVKMICGIMAYTVGQIYLKLALSAQAISQNIEKKTFPLGISKKWLFYMYFDFDDTTQC